MNHSAKFAPVLMPTLSVYFELVPGSINLTYEETENIRP